MLDKLYAGTKIADRDVRLGLIDKSTAEHRGDERFVHRAGRRARAARRVGARGGKERAGAYARLRPRYMEALLAKAGGLVAPDANSTLRVTYGQVKGVDARDGLFYEPQTTLPGILEKHDRPGRLQRTAAQLDAIRALRRPGRRAPYLDRALKDVPVNFLSTVDTTGGNSGSPTLNAKGELVGLLFDGTYESVASDYLFDEVKTRSIHVDSRYMLWDMTEVDGATNLVKEMGIKAGP